MSTQANDSLNQKEITFLWDVTVKESKGVSMNRNMERLRKKEGREDGIIDKYRKLE